jgi:hypothetical protein
VNLAAPHNFIKVNTGLYSIGQRIGVRMLFTGRVRKGGRVVIDGNSDHYALEAWERMTRGGVTARYGRNYDVYPVVIAHVGGRIQWVPLAAH